jgi:gluconolactonase
MLPRMRPWSFLPFLLLSAPAFAQPALIAPGVTLEKVVGDLKFSEGPAWNPKESFLLFEDTPRNRMMKLDRDGKVSVFREPSGRSNGLAWDAQGRLVVCEGNSGGNRRVTRTEKDGKIVVLADRYQGKRLNSPNDITIDGKGRIYFTDPRYSKREELELDKEAVYRIDPDGKLTRIIDTLTRPNGIVVTKDGRTLYVADNASPGGVVTLVAFDLDARGNASNQRVVYDFVSGRGIDGMVLDEKGRIWATAGTKEKAGIYVFEPDASRRQVRLVKTLLTPEDPTNVTFGGKDRDILYITTTASLFRIKTAVKGQASPPGK